MVFLQPISSCQTSCTLVGGSRSRGHVSLLRPLETRGLLCSATVRVSAAPLCVFISLVFTNSASPAEVHENKPQSGRRRRGAAVVKSFVLIDNFEEL